MNINRKTNARLRRGQSGQAALEYILIATLVGLALLVALLATGPVLGNIFSSVIIGAIGDDQGGREMPENGATSFWLTVTWVATQTPQESPFPTNIANPAPTEIPPGYEADTPVPPNPTVTYTPTGTDAPTATPEDIEFDLSFYDEAAQDDWYRLVGSNYLGQDSWEGLFYQDRVNDVTYDPFKGPGGVRYVLGLDANESSFITPLTSLRGMSDQWFSARFTRDVVVTGPDPREIGFRVSGATGGVRIYVNNHTRIPGFPCENYELNSTTRNEPSSDAPCLILDAWVDVPQDEYNAVIELPGGTDNQLINALKYTFTVEFYHRTGQPNLQVELFSPRPNRDDNATDGGNVDCNWRQYADGPRTNTRDFSWSQAVGVQDVANNSECHLELRGSVLLDDLPEGPPDDDDFTLAPPPVLTFWHIWDLPAGTTVRLEVAPYDRGLQDDGDDTTDPIADLDGKWSTVWDSGTAGIDNTSNYEWTQERVPLSSFSQGDTITYRFVIRNTGSSTARKLWFVDDITIGNDNLPDLTNPNPAPEDTFVVCRGTDPDPEAVKAACETPGNNGGYWSLDDAAQKADFRTTGRWDLTSNNGAVSGLAWEDDRGNAYSLEDSGDRVYYIEFDRRIDVTDTYDSGTGQFVDTFTDPDGDAGAPMLTFWQTYNLGDNARLEIQYYDDSTGEWRLLRLLAQSGDSPTAGLSRTDKHFVEVPLNLRQRPGENAYDGVGEGWTAWYENPLRLRFAMIVEQEASSAPDATGWTIDNILIERLGLVDFSPYPLKDSAGDDIDDEEKSIAESRNLWMRTGLWDIASGRTYGGGQYAFTDSPIGDYLENSNTVLQLRAPIDLFADTPQNPAAQNCDPVESVTGTCLPTGERQQPANEPTLTFWWNRDLANNHNFYVEIYTDGGVNAKRVWEYVYDADTATQTAWERAEIALWPFLDDNGTNIDDDITVVFRLDTTADASVSADGIWIDDIRIQDNDTNPEFLLGAGTNGGNGQLYYDDIDERQLLPGERFDNSDALRWWERFYLGGTWTGINTTSEFESQTGVLALHESPGMSEDPFDPAKSFRYEVDTFNTVEMIRHIDLSNIQTLRGSGDPIGYDTEGDDGSPMLVWWHRYDKGERTRLKVQIAAERTDTPPASTLTYGDDELYGWTNWQTVYITPPGAYNQNTREYQWVRERVNLQYATIYDDNGDAIGNENFVGRTIRVRFVLDANETVREDDVRDGWFIDNIQFTSFKPRIYTVPFTDNGDNTANWQMEGDWGLDVENARGGVNIPALRGDAGWSVMYLNCTRRPAQYTGVPADRDSNSGCASSEFERMLKDEGYRAVYDYTDDDTGAPGDLANPNNQWAVRDFISTLNFELDFNSNSGGRPPRAPDDFDWDDRYAAEFRRTIIVDEPYRYQFYVRSDDGVRVGITPFPATSEVQFFPETAFDVNAQVATGFFVDQQGDPNNLNPNYEVGRPNVNNNNIINAWRDQAPTVYQGAVTLIPNQDRTERRYELVVHYYESGGGAFLSFGMSGMNASFSDTPMLIPSLDKADRIPVNYYSDTAMELDGLLDLSGTNRPILNFWTLHELSNVNSTFYIQVSDDGGFTWNESNGGLTEDFRLADGTLIDVSGDTKWSGDEKDWVERTYNLSDYNNRMIAIRFRLDVNASETDVADAATNINNEYNGVNVSSIFVFDVDPPLSVPQIVSQSDLNIVVARNEEALMELIATGQKPLRYEWYVGPEYPTDPNVVPASATLVATNLTAFRPDTSNVTGTQQYWVRVSNTVSDTNPSVDPALSAPWLVRVLECVPQNVGDCGTYRLNFGGNDIPTNDGSLPGWAGTRDSADSNTFKPNGGVGVNQNDDDDIGVPGSHDSVFVQNAIDDNVAGEHLYESYIREKDPMTWQLPIENGAYYVRLVMADYTGDNDPDGRKSGRFAVTIEGQPAVITTGDATVQNVIAGGDGGILDGGIGDSIMELVYDSAVAVNNSYTGPTNQVGAILNLEAITVEDGVLDLTITPTEGRPVNIMGLETIPVSLDKIVITEQPSNRYIAKGFGTTLTVRATGPINRITWYQGVPPPNNGLPPEDTIVTFREYADDSLVRENTLTLPRVTETTSYFARVENTTPGSEQAVNTDPAQIEVCDFDPSVFGSCDRYYINVGEASNTFQSANGLVWHPDDPYRNGYNNSHRYVDTTEWPTFTPVPGLDLTQTNSGGGGSIFGTYVEDGAFGLDVPVALNGTYTVKLYFHDPLDRTNREIDILFEGFEYVDRYNPAGAPPTFDRLIVEAFTVTVLDSELNMYLQRRSGSAILSGMEFYPQSANVEILTNNLLTNPGFETGNFTDWTASGGTSRVVDTQAYEGLYAAELTRFGASPSFVRRTFFGLKENTRYTLSVRVKSSSPSNSAYLYIGTDPVNPDRASQRAFATDWTLVQLEFTTAPGQTSVDFGVARGATDGTGPVWFDNFSLVETP